MPSGFDVHVLGGSGGMFVVEDDSPGRGTYSFADAGSASGSGAKRSTLSMLRPSSMAILRANDADVTGADAFRDPNRGSSAAGNDERPSWWEKSDIELQNLSCGDLVLLFFETAVLCAIPAGILLAAVYADAFDLLPYIYSVFVALANYEFAWLAYRVRLRLFLPFKLHEKQTSRDLYAQIISYSVDLGTTAVTPLAEKCFRGNKAVAALVLAAAASAAAVALCFIPGKTLMPIVYVVLSTFLGVCFASLAPNYPSALSTVIRYGYYFLASLNVLLTKRNGAYYLYGSSGGQQDDEPEATAQITDKYLAVVLEPFSLLLVAAGVLMITRVLTCQEAMESAVLAVMDIVGLFYVGCFAATLTFFSRSPTADSKHVLAAFFVIAWGSEVGSFVFERLLKAAQFPWTHPLRPRVTTRLNYEKLVGAVGCAVGAVFLVAQVVDFDMDTPYVALLAATAVVFSHLCKLMLLSLKKIAKVRVTGRYLLRVGGGVLDRMDSLLFMAVVFCPFFQRALYDE